MDFPKWGHFINMHISFNKRMHSTKNRQDFIEYDHNEYSEE